MISENINTNPIDLREVSWQGWGEGEKAQKPNVSSDNSREFDVTGSYPKSLLWGGIDCFLERHNSQFVAYYSTHIRFKVKSLLFSFLFKLFQLILLNDVAITLTLPAALAEHASAGTGSALKNLAKCLKKNCSNLNNMAAKNSESK